MGFDPLVAAGDDAEAVDEEDIGAEVSNAVGDIKVKAGDNAHDRDKSGDSKNDAKERQETAELVSAEGVESETHGFGESNPATANAAGLEQRHGDRIRQTRDTRQAIHGSYAQTTRSASTKDNIPKW